MKKILIATTNPGKVMTTKKILKKLGVLGVSFDDLGISPKKVPGFCFAPVMQVLVDGEWKYDSELSEEDNWEAYWNIQAEAIKGLIEKCDY